MRSRRDVLALVPAAAGLVLLGIALRQPWLSVPACGLLWLGGRRRPFRAIAPELGAALLVALVLLVSLHRPDPAAWFTGVREEVDAAARERLAALERLEGTIDSLVVRLTDRPGDDPAAAIPGLLAWWRERPGTAGHPLGLVVRRAGERIAWGGTVEPFPSAGPDTASVAPVQRGTAGWYRRGRVVRDGVAWEWQVLLADTQFLRPGGHPRDGRFRWEIREGGRPHPPRWSGRPESGLHFAARSLLPLSADGDRVWTVRLSTQLPPFRQVLHQRRLRLRLLASLLYLLPVLLWSRRHGGVALLAALWWIRLVWAVLAPAARWLELRGDVAVPAAPGSPASLLDAAYVALPRAGGLGGSALDLLLTTLLAALTAAYLWRSRPRQERGAGRGNGAATPWRIGAVVVAALLLAVVWMRGVDTLAVAANPRLVGVGVPLSYPTFWALHLCLLAGGMALGWLVSSLAVRTGALPRPRGGWAWLLPLPLVVALNYTALTHSYDRMADTWLRDTATTLGGDREEAVRLLLGDLLTELASADAALPGPPRAHAPLAAPLWRDWRAYALWRRTAIPQLRRPGRLELLAADGTVSSGYAEGFLRDEAYEVVDRGAWETGRPARPRPGVTVTPYFQRELRRYAGGEEWILRGEIARLDTTGWVSLELPYRTARVSTVLSLLENPPPTGGYVPRRESDRPLLVMRGDDTGWRDAAGDDVPPAGDEPPVAVVRRQARPTGTLVIGGHRHRCAWADLPPDPHLPDGTGLLVALRLPSAGERLLDLSRLLLLDLLLLAVLTLPAVPWWWDGLRHALAGFQQRFLAVLLLLGLLPLALAGTFIDRLNRDWAASAARRQTRERLSTAESQLQSLLAEQARSLAASDYISDLLRRRLAGQRPVGPFAVRQAMVFGDDGRLLLDETLSDLDAAEAATVLEAARGQALVAMDEPGTAYLGTMIPVDLSWQEDHGNAATDGTGPVGPVTRPREGFFFYRQAITSALLEALAGSVGGEVALYLDGEAVAASHPAAVFSGQAPVLLPAGTVSRLLRQPGHTAVLPAGRGGTAWTGLLTLPLLRNDGEPPHLRRATLPAVLSVAFPARAREAERQRQRTALFLSGMATVIFLTAVLLGLVLAWRIFNPLRLLVEATRRLARGDYAAPLPPAGRDEVGTLAGAFAAMRDRLGRAQSELAARQRFLARLLEQVPVGVAVLEEDGRPAVLNPAMARILVEGYGVSRDAAADTAGAETVAACRRLLADVRRAAGGTAGEAEWRPGDGRRILRGRLAPLTGDADTAGRLLVVCEDVTEFVTAKRLAVSARMARQVAHEVKNPLTPIQLSVQFLERAWRDRAENMDEIVAGTVRQVLRQVELLRSIATEFSLLGRPDELPCEPLDPAAVVQEVLARYRAPGSDLPRVREEGGPPPPVLAHAESLGRVLGNLMENSLHAAGGLERLELVIRWRIEPGEVTLCWLDNGPGLSPEVLANLFEPYFSTRSGGTGLGLLVCRNLVSRMGGRFTLENRRDGNGAEARITLRRAAPADGEGGGDTP